MLIIIYFVVNNFRDHDFHRSWFRSDKFRLLKSSYTRQLQKVIDSYSAEFRFGIIKFRSRLVVMSDGGGDGNSRRSARWRKKSLFRGICGPSARNLGCCGNLQQAWFVQLHRSLYTCLFLGISNHMPKDLYDSSHVLLVGICFLMIHRLHVLTVV